MAYVELEHFCGFGGQFLGVVHYHPVQSETLLYSAGASIIIEDVNDPHKQEFFEAMMAISPHLTSRAMASFLPAAR